MRVAMAAAGSGGHVFPALAVADELRRRGLDHDDIVFFGGDRMEATVIPDAGYPFVGVDIHGIRRTASIDNLRLPGKVRTATTRIASTIAQQSLRSMSVFGGYIAGPAALAARRCEIPLIVHEANAVPGLANRMIARRADTVFTSFAAASARFDEAVLIGSPLRSEFTDFDANDRRLGARDRYGCSADEAVLAVVGGSLGAQFLNDVATVLANAPERSFSIVHVTGPTHFDEIAAMASEVQGWHPIAFEDEMADLYAAADLVLCRSGALTVSELHATRTPAVLVPLPAGKGYQAVNAADLADSGAARIVVQTEPDDVATVVMDLMADPDARATMRSANHPIDHGRAAATMAERILEVSHA